MRCRMCRKKTDQIYQQGTTFLCKECADKLLQRAIDKYNRGEGVE